MIVIHTADRIRKLPDMRYAEPPFGRGAGHARIPVDDVQPVGVQHQVPRTVVRRQRGPSREEIEVTRANSFGIEGLADQFRGFRRLRGARRDVADSGYDPQAVLERADTDAARAGPAPRFRGQRGHTRLDARHRLRYGR